MDFVDLVSKEIDILCKISNGGHPNVISFYGVCTIYSSMCVVLEYAHNGSLRDLLDDPSFEMTWNQLLSFAIGCAKGVLFLHHQNPKIIHRDIKASNILLTADFTPKIADFGLSKLKVNKLRKKRERRHEFGNYENEQSMEKKEVKPLKQNFSPPPPSSPLACNREDGSHKRRSSRSEERKLLQAKKTPQNGLNDEICFSEGRIKISFSEEQKKPSEKSVSEMISMSMNAENLLIAQKNKNDNSMYKEGSEEERNGLKFKPRLNDNPEFVRGKQKVSLIIDDGEIAGTECFLSPEIRKGKPYFESADSYSFGVFMWELITRKSAKMSSFVLV